MMIQSLKMAWNAVCSNKMRTFLTMLGIIIGVIALVVLVSIADGATSSVTDQMTRRIPCAFWNFLILRKMKILRRLLRFPGPVSQPKADMWTEP